MAHRAVDVVRIEIETPHNKTVYSAGESFDSTVDMEDEDDWWKLWEHL